MPEAPHEPIAESTLAAISREFIGGRWSQADIAPLAELLNGLERDMAAFHGAKLGELEPVLVYPPAREP